MNTYTIIKKHTIMKSVSDGVNTPPPTLKNEGKEVENSLHLQVETQTY